MRVSYLRRLVKPPVTANGADMFLHNIIQNSDWSFSYSVQGVAYLCRLVKPPVKANAADMFLHNITQNSDHSFP